MNTPSLPWVRLALPCCLLAAACGKRIAPEPSGDVLPTTSPINRAVEYVPKGYYWAVSALGGDRGPGWYQDQSPNSTNWDFLRAPLGYGETYVNPIPYGPDPANKPPTVYFKSTFYVTDVSHVHSLWLRIMYDDGFIAYINGHEVTRAQMPAGSVGYGTLATGHEANNTYESFDLAAARMFLINGTNTVAIEVHQVSASSSDLVFDASIDGDAWFDPPPPGYGAILPDDAWSFWDRGGDLGTAWRQPAFDASGWDFGVGALGYGETRIATPVAFGADPANKYITTYFRKQLIIDQPDSVTALHAYMSFDDGFVAYLNGQRIGSDAMPAGEITASTLALPHESTIPDQSYTWPVAGKVVQGLNTIAVEVHQASPSSSDLFFEMNVDLQLALPPSAPPDTIRRGSDWRYFDQGTDLGSAWRAPGYDDGAWPTGAGPLGYGESYLRTVTSAGGEPTNKPITTYFRQRFVVDVPSGEAITGLFGELMFDDGAVVYLNGHEVQRASMPVGTISANTRANDHEAGNAYTRFDWTSAKDFLVAGENVVAVEVHQTAPTSSDVVFDLALDVQTAPQFTKYAGNPIIDPSDDPSDDYGWQRYTSAPNVMKVGGSWVMFYDGTDGGPHDMIGRAVSADGIAWTRDVRPVETYGTRPFVIHDGSRYHMWVSQIRESGIWYGSSLDGITFARRPQPVIGASFQAAVVKDGDVFRMWHRAPAGLAYAISTDGVNWTHHPSLVFDAVEPFTVIKDGGEYKMWFADKAGLIYATSPDGLNWRRRGVSLAAGVFDLGPDGEWDAQVGRASVVRDGAGLKMWYSASGVVNGASVSGIGYATSP